MTQNELNKLIDADVYCRTRKDPTEFEIRLFLNEVDYHCPLCGKEFQYRNQKKPNKQFEIAHIYPNRPTADQYQVLYPLNKRLGDNSESFENKIALCKDCHDTQDYHTTKEEYMKLYDLKSRLLTKTAMNDITESLGVEDQISVVITGLTELTEADLADLNYEPVPIANKFYNNELLLKTKIFGYVNKYYPYIRNRFNELDGKNKFHMQILSEQVKACFIKLNDETQDKNMILNQIVQWFQKKTLCQNINACEAVASFFVQNCEVFYEIAQ